MSATGNIEIDFGVGSSEVFVDVTGQASILSTHSAEAWIMAEASSNHTLNDHKYAALFIAITCSIPVDGVGFTIWVTSTEKLNGKFKLRWVWA
jgi:hypothetical protein